MSDVKTVMWKRGYRNKIKAEVAFKELEKIKASNNDVLTAGIVLLSAKKVRSPLHKQFEWDDTAAAEEYRLGQARLMMRCVEVVYTQAPSVAPQRHYSVVTEQVTHDAPERKVYRSTAEILADPVARDEMLGNAIRDAISFRRKYAAMQELAQVFHAMDDFMEHNKAV